MTVLAIENWPKTPLGLVGEELRASGLGVTICRAFAGDPVPEAPDGYDALIMLGGAQDALADAQYPFLAREAGLARRFVAADKAVLGICLGSQILARAMGGDNVLGRPIEFGWHEVTPTEAGATDPVLGRIAPAAPVFHWHGDTFTLPPDAVHLATSRQTINQAFRVGRAGYGIQFHFEAGTALVADWTRDLADEIAPLVPDWAERYPEEARRSGPAADAAGRSLARAWIAQIR